MPAVGTYAHNVRVNEKFRVRIGQRGTFVIPAELRSALALEEGTEALASAQDGRLVVERRDAVVRRVRETVARVVGDEVNLVDELLAARREELRNDLGRHRSDSTLE